MCEAYVTDQNKLTNGLALTLSRDGIVNFVQLCALTLFLEKSSPSADPRLEIMEYLLANLNVSCALLKIT